MEQESIASGSGARLVFMDLWTDYLENLPAEMGQMYACEDACNAPGAIGCSRSVQYVHRAHAGSLKEDLDNRSSKLEHRREGQIRRGLEKGGLWIGLGKRYLLTLNYVLTRGD